MSVFAVRDLACRACGRPRTVKVVESANPSRHPQFGDQLLDRTFHRFACPECGHVDVLDGPMLWTDVAHGLVAAVLPLAERLRWAELELAVDGGLSGPVRREGPPFVRAWGEAAAIRAVFGLEELREKVVASRAGIDDRVVEVLKLPHVDAAAAIGPVLDAVDDDGLHLVVPPPDPGTEAAPVAVVPWAEYQSQVDAIDAATAHHPGLFGGTWVHWLRAPFPLAG